MASLHKQHQPSSYLVWLFVFVALVWCLRGMLLASQVPAFRDGFHFYWPQLVWLDQAYQSGEYVPTWNANEGLGSSVSAQPTWQIYYPLRVVFLVPGLELAPRLGLFVLLHLLLSVLGMLRAARTAGLSSTASWLSAIAFSLSCPVMFQVNNLIYLCSAAWVACSISALVRLMNFRRYDPGGAKTSSAKLVRIIFEIAGCGSMMTLCGDPHGAVNLGLIAIAVFISTLVRAWFAHRSGTRDNKTQTGVLTQFSATQREQPVECHETVVEGSTLGWLKHILLCGSVSMVIVLAGFQTFQSIHWYQHSTRSSSASTYVDSFDPNINRILHNSALDHPRNTFDFSLSPWNLSTLVWPTFNGHFQPENSRWVQAVPSESRMWVPSLYLGIVPIVLAISGLRSTGDSKSIHRYLAVIALVSLLLAMGNYSIVWLLRNLLHAIAPAQSTEWLPTDGQGSLYGLLVQYLPGYGGFRYPAKWIVWTTCCLALMAGLGTDQLNQSSISRRFTCQMCVLACVSGLMLVILIVAYSMLGVRSRMELWLLDSADRLVGSAGLTASFYSIIRALIQTSVFCGLALFVRKNFTRETQGNETREVKLIDLACGAGRMHRLGMLLVVITLVDLSALQSSWITTTDSDRLKLMQFENKHNTESLEVAPSSKFVWANVAAADLATQADMSRASNLERTLELQNTFLLGKLCHVHSIAAMHASGSIEPKPVVAIRRWLQQNDSLQVSQPDVDSVLAELGVSARLVQPSQGQLRWQAIPNARPPVELFNEDKSPLEGQAADAQLLTYKWLNHQTLQIQFKTDRPSILVVRQFSDGDWKIRHNSELKNKNVPQPLAIQPNELFVSIPFPPGEFDLTLGR